MNITIIPGSYKPPHKGHLSLIEKLIKNNSKIIIIISKKERPLDSRFLYPNEKSKEELQSALIFYFPEDKNKILSMTKSEIIKNINEMIHKNIIKSINSDQSLKVWKIYIKYLKEKYLNIPKIELKIPETNNIIREVNKTIIESFKERPKKIILMKSMKNKDNTRFDYFEDHYKKYVETVLFPNIKDIDATGMRESILNSNKDKFIKYLPNNLNPKYINKIWKIVNT